ncbi:MAG TPA: ATP-dependent metallopeptidase FtsH/Yme1/Tma family protein [Chloroflexia bacterium]|jgi:ATP-dependent Zn protease
MNAQKNASHEWEYTEVQVRDPLSAIRQYREQGWELVNAVSVPMTPAAPAKPLLPRACLPLLIAVGVIMLFVLFFTFLGGRPREEDIPISEIVQDIRSGRVAAIVRREESNRLTLYYGDPNSTDTQVVTSIKEPESSLLEYLVGAGIPQETLDDLKIEVQPTSSLGNYLGLAGFCLPAIFFVATVAWAGWRLQSRTQQWGTLAIFRRPAATNM